MWGSETLTSWQRNGVLAGERQSVPNSNKLQGIQGCIRKIFIAKPYGLDEIKSQGILAYCKSLGRNN